MTCISFESAFNPRHFIRLYEQSVWAGVWFGVNVEKTAFVVVVSEI